MPRSIRHTLSIEAGANDVIILPVVVVLATIASHDSRGAGTWLWYGVKLYLLGPLIGVAIAYLAIKAMVLLRRRPLVQRDYESIYSVGIALLAYAGAELAGGSGFLAAFAAGLTIAIVDVELCECSLEYGETTAEMAMLLTFVFLGSALVDSAVNAWGWERCSSPCSPLSSPGPSRSTPFSLERRQAALGRRCSPSSARAGSIRCCR